MKEVVIKKEKEKDEFEKAIEKFFQDIFYKKPPCFGERYAFPDGDIICDRCPLFQVTEKMEKEIKAYTKYLIENKKEIPYGITAEELAMATFSCRFASDLNLRLYNRAKRLKEESIRERLEKEEIAEERIRKAVEAIDVEFDNRKRRALKLRKELIEKMIKETTNEE
jgi:nicotinamide mononucleotide adenylyltransferase